MQKIQVKIKNHCLKNLSFAGTGGLVIPAFNRKTHGELIANLTTPQLNALKSGIQAYKKPVEVSLLEDEKSEEQRITEEVDAAMAAEKEAAELAEKAEKEAAEKAEKEAAEKAEKEAAEKAEKEAAEKAEKEAVEAKKKSSKKTKK